VPRLLRSPTIRYIAARAGQGLAVVAGAVVLSFVLTVMSGNPARLQAGPYASQAQVAALAHREGYDRPVPERLVRYFAHVVQGDFGHSYRRGEAALSITLSALPYTIALVLAALAVGLLVAVPIVLLPALRGGTRSEPIVRNFALLGQGVPEFWLGILLVLLFSVTLAWLPSFGYGGPSSMVLPTLTLAVPLIPALVRILGGQLATTMESDFIMAQRVKGLRERNVVLRHGVRNALPGAVTYLALQVGYLVAGTVVVESVFQWPGIGSLLLDAVANRDIVIVQAIVVEIAVVYVVLNLLADVFVLWLDPRVARERA
jgi:ABC-type dipeptide/oligopeptide/nickel transport system permease component